MSIDVRDVMGENILYSLWSGILSVQSEIVRDLVSNQTHFSVMYKEQKFSLC